jgi:hypothetical protein
MSGSYTKLLFHYCPTSRLSFTLWVGQGIWRYHCDVRAGHAGLMICGFLQVTKYRCRSCWGFHLILVLHVWADSAAELLCFTRLADLKFEPILGYEGLQNPFV